MNKTLGKAQEAKPALYTYRKSQPLHLPADKRECERRLVHERCDLLVTILEIPDVDPASIELRLVGGIVTDLSPKGIGLNLVHRLEPGSIVEIDIRGSIIRGKVKARVAWCAAIPTTGHVIKTNPRSWRAGVEVFLESDEQKEFMLKLVKSL